MKVLTAEQMREIDRRTTAECGVPSLQLMENAGSRVVEFLGDHSSGLAAKRVVVLCGKGSNGGDGLVVARLLRGLGCEAKVLLFAAAEEVQGDAAVNLKRWVESGGQVRHVLSQKDWEAARCEATQADVVVDALLGTGLVGGARGLLASVIEDVNAGVAREKVVSVDMPSGLPSGEEETNGPVIRAGHTITFTAPKVAQLVHPLSQCVGELLVRSIGTPAGLLQVDPNLNLHWLEPGEFAGLAACQPRRKEAHKGDFGHALIVAGSLGKTGAAVLAAWGALRSGAGLVTVATAEGVLPIVASALAEIMTEPLASTEAGTIGLRSLDYGRFDAIAQGKQVLGMGSGLSTQAETQQFARAVLARTTCPVILDADGLNAFAGRPDELRKRAGKHLAITPHPGEMARLLGVTTEKVQKHRLEVAREAATRWNAVVVLKGYRTIVASPEGSAFINSTGNPGMATGGTGDVLCGILTGLTAQFGVNDWARLMSFGVYLHGLAGDLATAEVGEAPLIASDLIGKLPEAFSRLISGPVQPAASNGK
jgi:NAD(P)H-hydrate epimerase